MPKGRSDLTGAAESKMVVMAGAPPKPLAKAGWVLPALIRPLSFRVERLNPTRSLYAGACLSVNTSSENFLEFLLACSIEPRASGTILRPRLHKPCGALPRLGRGFISRGAE